jgi:DNA ligase (NAD+)
MSLNSSIFEKPSCKFKFLQREGFNTPNYYELLTSDDVLRVYRDYMISKRDTLSYDIDGLVQEIDDFDAQKELGFQPNGLIPKFATSIKFDSMGAVTKLIDVRWTVGMTGKIIPTGIFEPIDVMGVTITKASLHNFELLDTLINKDGLRIGSKVLICRKGDVIPQVVSVIPDKEKKPYIQIPAECPECGETLNRFSVNLVCDNIACSAKTKGIFTNMFSTLDIKGLSDKFVEKATEVYDITTIDELMNLTVDEIEKLPGFAKKSAQKAYDTIHSVTDVTPEQFFALLNIPNQGVRVFENLFSQFPMEKLLDNSFKPEDILDTKGIAEKSANAIHTGIQSNLDRLRENAKWFTIIKKDVVTSPENHKAAMMGKSFCITGTLNLGTRKDYETLILSSGGKISAVTKNLDFLVTNDADTSSSKMKKALEINSTLHNNGVDKKIVIIDENQLRNILEI